MGLTRARFAPGSRSQIVFLCDIQGGKPELTATPTQELVAHEAFGSPTGVVTSTDLDERLAHGPDRETELTVGYFCEHYP